MNDDKEKLHSELGKLVIIITKKAAELKKLQEQANNIATEIEELERRDNS